MEDWIMLGCNLCQSFLEDKALYYEEVMAISLYYFNPFVDGTMCEIMFIVMLLVNEKYNYKFEFYNLKIHMIILNNEH